LGLTFPVLAIASMAIRRSARSCVNGGRASQGLVAVCLPELAAPQFAVQGRRDTLTAGMSFASRLHGPGAVRMVESGAARPATKDRARVTVAVSVAVVSAGAGRPVAKARSTTGIEEVLVARTASGLVTTKCEAILEPVTKRH